MKSYSLYSFNKLIIFGFGIVAFLYFASSLVVPLAWAFFLATLVAPLCNKLEEMGMKRLSASALSTLVVFVGVTAVFYFITVQTGSFFQDLNQSQNQLRQLTDQLLAFLSDKLNVSREELVKFFKTRAGSFRESLEQWVKKGIGSFFSGILNFLLVMIYLFLMLLKRDKYEQFILKLSDPGTHEKTRELTGKVNKVAGEYLRGRLKVMSILGIMYLVIMLAFGLKHAFLVTLIGTVLTIIPYIGPFLSGLLPIIVGFTMGMGYGSMIGLVTGVVIAQLIESYVLEPVIIGEEVNLSPIAIIIAIIAGGMLWGISGMILFVPLAGVIRIICQYIDPLQPVAFLLADNYTQTPRFGKMVNNWFRRWRKS